MHIYNFSAVKLFWVIIYGAQSRKLWFSISCQLLMAYNFSNIDKDLWDLSNHVAMLFYVVIFQVVLSQPYC